MTPQSVPLKIVAESGWNKSKNKTPYSSLHYTGEVFSNPITNLTSKKNKKTKKLYIYIHICTYIFTTYNCKELNNIVNTHCFKANQVMFPRLLYS